MREYTFIESSTRQEIRCDETDSGYILDFEDPDVDGRFVVRHYTGERYSDIMSGTKDECIHQMEHCRVDLEC